MRSIALFIVFLVSVPRPTAAGYDDSTAAEDGNRCNFAEDCTSTCGICLIPRPYDGYGVNSKWPSWGAAGTPLRWSVAAAAYADDGTTPVGGDLLSARTIAQQLYLKGRPFQSTIAASQAFPHWALFNYFDMVQFTANADESFDIPCDDGVIDEQCPATCSSDSGTVAAAAMPFYRAKSTLNDNGVRVAINEATAYMDLSHVYGLSEDAARALRTFEGGQLNLTTAGLPWRLADGSYLLADQRNAFNLGTLALATLFMREHNRKAATLTAGISDGSFSGCQPTACDTWGDDELFEAARQWTIAAYQHTTTQEFIPTLLGQAPASSWALHEGESIDPGADTLFAAVASRWMWSAMGPTLRLLDGEWAPLQEYDPLPLRHASDAGVMANALELYGLEPVLRGLMAAPAADVDATVTDELVSFLTAEPVRDIQRARDLGVPGYNAARAAYGLPVAASFAEVTSDAKSQRLLADLYGSVPDGMDALVGALAEDAATSPVRLAGGADLTSYSDNYFIGWGGSDAQAASSSLSEGAAAPAASSATVPAIGPLIRASLLDQYHRLYEGDMLFHVHSNTLESTMDTTFAALAARNPDPNPETGAAGVPMTNMPLAGFRVANFNLTSTNNTGVLAATFKLGVYSVEWSEPSGGNIVLTFTVAGMGTQGYVALGIGTDMRSDADIIFLAFETDDYGDVTVTPTDRFSSANGIPVLDSAAGFEENPALLNAFSCADGTCTVTVTRELDTGDTGDKAIRAGDVNIIWSFNLDASDRQHGFDDRGQMIINFYTGASQTVSSSQKDFFALHGIVMLIAFAFSAPAALIVARYGKQYVDWLSLHEGLGVFTAQASIPIAAAAIASSTRPRFITVHGKLGLAMLVLISLQALTGYLRLLGIENRGNKFFGDNYGRLHWANVFVHRWMGRGIVPLGLFQCFLGLGRISPEASAMLSVNGIGDNSGISFSVSMFGPIRLYLFWIWLGILAAVFVYLEWSRLRRKVMVRTRLEDKGRLPVFTQEEFDDRVLQGAKWVVVNDMVINIADYMQVHPGGSKVVKEHIGLDVTAFLAGKRTVGKGVFVDRVHKHTAAAYNAMMPFHVGYIQKHDLFTEDGGPNRAVLGKAGSDGTASGSVTSSRSSASNSSGALRRGRGFGPRFSSYEVVKKIAMGSRILPRRWEAERAGTGERPVVLFTLAPCDKSEKADALRPGWYFKFRAMYNGNMVQRQYTPVASRVLNDGRIGYDFYIRLLPGGQMSEFLRSARAAVGMRSASIAAGAGLAAARGSVVGVQGPFVITELGEQYERIYMLAGGTGVTPMLQVARYHVRAMLAVRLMPQPPGSPAAAAGGGGNAAAMGGNGSDGGSDGGGGGSGSLEGAAGQLTAAFAAPSAEPSLAATVAAKTATAAAASPSIQQAPASAAAAAATQRGPAPRSQWPALRKQMLGSASAVRSAGSVVREWQRYDATLAGLEPAERQLLAPDGGNTDALASFRPATMLALLWQTHDARDGFCGDDLVALTEASDGAFSFRHFFKEGGGADAAAEAALLAEEQRGSKMRPWRRGSKRSRFGSVGSTSCGGGTGGDGSGGDGGGGHVVALDGPADGSARRRCRRSMSTRSGSGAALVVANELRKRQTRSAGSAMSARDARGGGGGGEGGEGGTTDEDRNGDTKSELSDSQSEGKSNLSDIDGEGPHPTRGAGGSGAVGSHGHLFSDSGDDVRSVGTAAAAAAAGATAAGAAGVNGDSLPPAAPAAASMTARTEPARAGSAFGVGRRPAPMPSRPDEIRSAGAAVAAVATAGNIIDLEAGVAAHSASIGFTGGGDSGSERHVDGNRDYWKCHAIGTLEVTAMEKQLEPLLSALRTKAAAATGVNGVGGGADDAMEALGSVLVVVSGSAVFADGMLATLKALGVPESLILCLD